MKTEYKTKTKVNYSIDKEVCKQFGILSKQKAINKSQLIELFIIDWIKNNK